MVPIYFLYTDELNAQENWENIATRFKAATPIKSIGTIFESHKHIASQCTADKFYVVDADCWIVDGFKFDGAIELAPRSVAVYRAKNPVNGLVYGHGGIKLFSKDCFSADRLDRPDMTTTLADSYIKLNILASEHRFNYSPYATWRTAFREAAKLSSGVNKNNNDQESLDRLAMWQQAGLESKFGYFSVMGARQGVSYVNDGGDTNQVNDFIWLEQQFKEWVGI